MADLPFTLRQLEIFELLCELRSFRGVSERLGISQASVSSQLKALETQMGAKLLERESGRRPQPTPIGLAFLSDLSPFWKAVGKLSAHRRAVPGTGPVPPCRIRAMIGLQLLQEYIRPALGGFLREHPNYQLSFDSAAAFFGPREAVEKEPYDLGLFSERADIPLGKHFQELTRVECGIFGHPKFAASHTLPLTVDELSTLPFVLPPRGSFYERETVAMLNLHGIIPARIVGRSQYFDVMSAMYEAGTCVGVSLLPFLSPEQRKKSVLLHRLDDWRLTLYRNPDARQPQASIVERFLVETVMHNPDYPPFAERA